jgi:nucleoside-diphosphate-sugar epimerase
MHIILTGGTGYIGRRVLQMALRQGHCVTLLGTDDARGAERAIAWRLGEAVPEAVWSRSADAVIHLAHVWHAQEPEADDINVRGTAALLQGARRAGVSCFVFASSLSARAQALNRYGRVKYRIETLLEGDSEIAARIGLAYGGPRKSLWNTLCRISALPVLPLIGIKQPMQPIHIDDAAEGLLRLAALPAPRPRHVVLAGEPIAFGDFLRAVAQCLYGRQPILLPLPLPPLLFVLRALGKIGLPVHDLSERILGLAGITVQPGTADAARIGLSPRPLDAGLGGGVKQHARAAEAAAYLRYILERPASAPVLRRYLRGWRRYEFGDLVLPRLLKSCPVLLRFTEPLPSDRRPRAQAVRARLHAAAVLAEAEPDFSARLYASVPHTPFAAALRMAALGALEATLLVPRAAVGYWLWR